MNHFFVWLRRWNGSLALVGELATTDTAANGSFEAEFEYSREWASDPTGFALDPASLPMTVAAQRFRAEQFHPPLAVFDDALPDDWGRRLLSAAIKLEGGKPSPSAMLLRMQGGGTGALQFTERRTPPTALATTSSRSLASLLSAAAKFATGTLPMDDQFRKLLDGSSRAGGARPKALVHDEDGEWVAKFPSRERDAGHDVIGLEAACLEVARRAGLEIPQTRLHTVGRRRVLLVKRFDVPAAGGRTHMISLRTICKERPGIFVTGYSELAQAIGRYSAAPAMDVAALYRHMTFNAAVGNVDDHLKNFWMLATPAGYRLAPAFDLVPDISGRGEHTLAFQYNFTAPTRAELLGIAEASRVADAATIIDDVVKAARTFASVARKCAVRDDGHLKKLQADVQQRIKLLRD